VSEREPEVGAADVRATGEVSAESGLLFERVAALDIAKATLVACVRTPADDPGRGRRGTRRRQVLRDYSTLTPRLLELADWLRVEQVEVVAMEATGDYWKPVYYLLEAEGLTVWLCNAKHVKNLPGRAKTDRADAAWLAKVVERGMCAPSLVHPKPIRRLRDLTRYRRSLVREQTREKQRMEKLLEDAQVKLSSVISDIFGVSGRQMLQAMIAGERNTRVLAEMARGSMRRKIPVLTEALTGHFEDHHAFLAQVMLDRIDELDRLIGQVSDRITEAIEPFRAAVEKLIAIPGIGPRAAEDLIAEIGVDMTRFRTSDQLVSWAKFAPVERTSANRSKTASTGKGNPWLGGILGEVVAAAARTDTFLGARYRRLARRRGKRRAIVAVGNSVLTIVWHLLADPKAQYHELGSGWHDSRINRAKRERDLIRQLERLTGKKVTFTAAA
jgi:transposase